MYTAVAATIVVNTDITDINTYTISVVMIKMYFLEWFDIDVWATERHPACKNLQQSLKESYSSGPA